MLRILILILVGTITGCASKKNKMISAFPVNKGWQKTDSILFENPQVSDNRVIVKSLWNSDSLYFRFDVSDRLLRAEQTVQDHPELYLDDMVEVLIDANNDKDSCWTTDDIVYHINLLGIKKDDRGTPGCETDAGWNGSARYKVILFGKLGNSEGESKGYRVEIALPWTELGLVPHEGLSIGVNFANGDNDGNGRQLFDWCGVFPLRSPFAFGTLILKD
jgi:hypothetical protein